MPEASLTQIPPQDLLSAVEADSGTVGTEIKRAPAPSQTRTTALLLTEDAGILRSRVHELGREVVETHQQTHSHEWRVRAGRRAVESPQGMLTAIGDMGFAWRDVARLLDVSVAAVQKWRRGDNISGDNRQKLASFLAACDLLAAHFYVNEIGSWFETPLVGGVLITPMDMWAAGRTDLVFEHASGQQDPETTLTEFDDEWRVRYSSEFEVFEADDGNLSIRPKD